MKQVCSNWRQIFYLWYSFIHLFRWFAFIIEFHQNISKWNWLVYQWWISIEKLCKTCNGEQWNILQGNISTFQAHSYPSWCIKAYRGWRNIWKYSFGKNKTPQKCACSGLKEFCKQIHFNKILPQGFLVVALDPLGKVSDIDRYDNYFIQYVRFENDGKNPPYCDVAPTKGLHSFHKISIF